MIINKILIKMAKMRHILMGKRRGIKMINKIKIIIIIKNIKLIYRMMLNKI